MFALRKATLQAPQLLNTTVRTHTGIVCTPPRIRISGVEKLLHGLVFYVGVMAIPVWVMTNMKHYKKAKK